MENASKALLMAGGILIALMVIGALVIMLNQIGDYQRAQDSNEKTSQLAQFNYEFERYTDDKGIKGTDIISLINKVIDYNQRAASGGVNNSVDYGIKMSITVSGLDNFNKKYAYDKENDSDSLFQTGSYTFIGTNTLKKTLDNFTVAEGNIGIENLKKLSAIYNPDENKNTNIENIKAKLVEIDSDNYKNWNGYTVPTLDTIKKYRQYSEFKSSTFKISNDPVYENGQIKDLSFEFDK